MTSRASATVNVDSKGRLSAESVPRDHDPARQEVPLNGPLTRNVDLRSLANGKTQYGVPRRDERVRRGQGQSCSSNAQLREPPRSSQCWRRRCARAPAMCGGLDETWWVRSTLFGHGRNAAQVAGLRTSARRIAGST